MARELNLDLLVSEPVTVTLGGHKYQVRGDLDLSEIIRYFHTLREMQSGDEERVQAGFEAAADMTGMLLSEQLEADAKPPPLKVSVEQFVGLFSGILGGMPEEVVAQALSDDQAQAEEGDANATPLRPNRSTRRSAKRSPSGSSSSKTSTQGSRPSTGGTSDGARSAPTSPGRSADLVAAK